jgi:plasmid segregation protein ParM
MNIGLDIGYSAVKAVNNGRPGVTFPSVVGTPERARFSLNGNAGTNIFLNLLDGTTWLVGHGAVEQSRFVDRREDRDWIASDAYHRLMLAAFTELTAATACDLVVVTGLPVAFFEADKARLRDVFLGEHRAGREGRRQQLFRVTDCRVIPQPFGALLAHTLDDRGRVVDQALATGAVGIIDVGGKTTNLLSVNRLSEIARETASVNVGAWDAARAVGDHLATHCPDLALRDHQVIEAVISRTVTYYGDTVELGTVVDATLESMAEQVIAQATQLWNGGASLKAILVSGGGAHLLGPYIRRRFRHAHVVADPVFANALGYWRLAQRSV